MPPDSQTLAAWIAAAARGDRVAFKALYDATAPKLFGLLMRISRDRATAEEILQEAYLRIWRSASSYSPESGPPIAWMASIARHRAIDVLRQKTEVLIGPDEEGADWFARIPEGRDREGEIADVDALRHCLGRLEETQRGCILLAYYEGYSREELAERFDRPVNTIKTWLHRGLAALRGCLEDGASSESRTVPGQRVP